MFLPRGLRPARLTLARMCLAAGLAGWPAACRSPAPRPGVIEVPFIAQSPDRCGTAAVAMLLRNHGREPDLQELDRDIHIPALAGSIPSLLAEAARRQGFAADVFRGSPADIHRLILQGHPLILMLGPDGNDPRGHFVVATGFHPRTRALRVHSGDQANQWWKARVWQPRWEAAGAWIVWIRPGPGGGGGGGDLPESPEKGRVPSDSQ